MIRITFVIATLDRGGSETQLVRLAGGLDRSRFQPSVICLTRGGPLEGDLARARVRTFILHKRHKVDLTALRRLTGLLRLVRPHIVHTWLFTANAYGRWAALRAGVLHLVASERSTDPGKPWLHRLIDRRLTRRTARIVANCQAVRRVYRARLGLPARRLVVIPNGLPLRPPEPRAREHFRSREGLPRDALIFVTAGRLERTKATDVVVRALAEVSASLPRAWLVVVGDGSELARLKALASGLAVARRVIFLGEVAEPAEVLAAADVFVFASLYEGLPNVVLEAMGAGLPVVATEVGGVPEVVSEGESGFLVPPRRAGELARRMSQLAADEELRQRLGRAGRARAGEFTVERMVRAYEDLYQEVLSETPPPVSPAAERPPTGRN